MEESWKKAFLCKEKGSFTTEGYQAYSKLVAHERYVSKVCRGKEVAVGEEELANYMEKGIGKEEVRSVEDEAILSALIEQLYKHIKKLNEEEIFIITELYFENTELSYCKIAKKLGIPRSTLQSREKKVLKKLERMFEGEDTTVKKE